MIDTERVVVMAAEHAAMKAAIHTLFAVGGAGGMEGQEPQPLPRGSGPGTVAVRLDQLARLAKAGGIG